MSWLATLQAISALAAAAAAAGAAAIGSWSTATAPAPHDGRSFSQQLRLAGERGYDMAIEGGECTSMCLALAQDMHAGCWAQLPSRDVYCCIPDPASLPLCPPAAARKFLLNTIRSHVEDIAAATVDMRQCLECLVLAVDSSTASIKTVNALLSQVVRLLSGQVGAGV